MDIKKTQDFWMGDDMPSDVNENLQHFAKNVDQTIEATTLNEVVLFKVKKFGLERKANGYLM
jgi:hypothetical protein